MDRNEKSAVQLLDENSPDVLKSVTSLLLQICDNILNHPEEIKFRRLRLSNSNVAKKLLPATGAIECLFEMGFEEADDSFVLPGSSSLRIVKEFREKLAKKISQNHDNNTAVVPAQVSASNSRPPMVTPDSSMMSHPFLHKIYVAANGVLEFERENLQKKARACVPEGELWIAAENRLHNIQLEKVGVIEAERKGLPDLFLIELLQWFKHSFFSWVDKPFCQFCSGSTSFVGLSADPSHLAEAPRTELFSCSGGHITPFHRYTNLSKLLETRKGRCGEWAACFTLICRSLGMDARQVFDETDHVWTEVWSTTQCRWLHCDSCESICDAPLTYQAGWGKKLTYCIAYSRDDVQDVTWRYTQEPTEVVLARRTQCSESELLRALLDIRTKLQLSVTKARKAYLERRLLQELTELLKIPGKQRVVSETETQGRQSGSKEWREQRRETGQLKTNWVWTPTTQEIEAKCMTVKFSAARNCYQQAGSQQLLLQGWTRGIYQATNIARKEERDWKKVYLARTEGSQDRGCIEWRFEVPVSTGLEIDSVNLQLSSTTFSSGVIHWRMLADKIQTSINLPPEGGFLSDKVRGCHCLTLQAELLGGTGQVAWQHVQLCRQDLEDLNFPLQVVIKLRAS